MSNIFASEFARTGVLPDSGRHRVDSRKPRATFPAIGSNLQDDETIVFQRITDGDYEVEHCYLPWCAKDFREVLLSGDPAHQHTGTEKRIETGIPAIDGEIIEADVIRLSIEQTDHDGDDYPEHITGDPHAFLAIGGPGRGDGAYVVMTAEKLLELSNTATTLAQLIFATRGLINPNRATSEDIRRGQAAQTARLAGYVAEREARKAADAITFADLDSAYDLARRIGTSWPCARICGAVIGLFSRHRKGFKLGLKVGIEVYRNGGAK